MNELTYVDITDDSLEVVVASNTSIVVYEFDGSSFILSQNITVNESLRSVQVSDSHKYLSVGVLGNQIYIFEKVSN